MQPLQEILPVRTLVTDFERTRPADRAVQVVQVSDGCAWLFGNTAVMLEPPMA